MSSMPIKIEKWTRLFPGVIVERRKLEKWSTMSVLLVVYSQATTVDKDWEALTQKIRFRRDNIQWCEELRKRGNLKKERVKTEGFSGVRNIYVDFCSIQRKK